MEFTSDLHDDAGLIPTNLQMQTTSGDIVNVQLNREVPGAVTQTEPLEDKTNQMTYIVLKNKISMDCYHEISMLNLSMPRSYKVQYLHVFMCAKYMYITVTKHEKIARSRVHKIHLFIFW